MDRRSPVAPVRRASWARASASLRRGAPIAEVKRRLDGSEERFGCELVRATPSEAVILYRLRSPAWGLPAPLLSYGFFWRRRPYICYRFIRPGDGAEVASRFDVVGRVELVPPSAVGGPAEVRYEDLLLDLWVWPGAGPGGSDDLLWEDEEELQAATSAGRIGPGNAGRVRRARGILLRNQGRLRAAMAEGIERPARE